MDPRVLLRDLFETAVRTADPRASVASAVPSLIELGPRSVLVVGAGKASAQMASALEAAWPVSGPPLEGVVVTRYGHGVSSGRIEVMEAAHPVPDAMSVKAAEVMLSRVRSAPADGLIVCLLSGGGSSLLCGLPDGVPLEDLQSLTQDLLSCGATIAEINCVRRHLSTICGGRLAASNLSRIVTLAVSDVADDVPFDICSGPTVGDPTTLRQARSVLDRYRLKPADSILARLSDEQSESIKPGDPSLARSEFRILISPKMAIDAAARRAGDLGVESMILSYDLAGDSRQVAASHATTIRDVLSRRDANAGPLALLSGGETSVRVSGSGKGGRNVEFLVSLAKELDGLPGVFALAADTDGVDGNAEIAGAFIDPTTVARACKLGLAVEEILRNNDCHSLFRALGDSLVTGPTGTNVNDFRAVLISQVSG